ncbi:HAMP domain-containing protein [Sinirhodobacter populi]|uniref:histidine kinase n=2 Tax=Paenirhodobacter populi TaxID=2306993 RepID=A0A443KGR0_9RHOB|nr:HAMP domain-containing protein [Sinirhodobacter populi]
MSTTGPSTATSSACARRCAQSIRISSRSKRSTGSAIATMRPDPARGTLNGIPGTTWLRRLTNRGWRPSIRLGHSPLTRKIIAFNLTAILLMVVGVLSLNPFRNSMVVQQQNALMREADLLALLFETQLDSAGTLPVGSLRNMILPGGSVLHLFDSAGNLLAETMPPARPATAAPEQRQGGFLSALLKATSGLRPADTAVPPPDRLKAARSLVAKAAVQGTATLNAHDSRGQPVFGVARRIESGGGNHVLSLTIIDGEIDGEIDGLMRVQREQVLQVFVIAIIVSIGLSLVLASAISSPLAELARAAEAGQTRHGQRRARARVRIPDFDSRPDEIGRLSTAMRQMVDALYDRIDANEQFAADVAHEIKNPLASLRSAAMSLTRVLREDQRQKLIAIIDKDVGRLDRLVSDISNASRLDRDLVREDEESFDLARLLAQLCAHYRTEAEARGIRLLDDLPTAPVVITGLEPRLAQVFVNLIANALSFTTTGGTIRVQLRRHGKRLLIVVEDTGPGIPDEALTKVFQRFYSQRPAGSFGEHSGLGLAISRQIVEAHGGVIWAENIRPPDAEPGSPPGGARFVVGIPL